MPLDTHANWTPMDGLRTWATSMPDTTYLVQPIDGETTSFTWADVDAQSSTVGGYLQSLGFETGDRVAVMSKNCALSVGIVFAAETSANSSGLTFMPKMPCGSGTVRVPASRVVTSNPPSLMRLNCGMAMPIISAAARAGLAAAAATGSAAAEASTLRRVSLGLVIAGLLC